MNGFSIRKFPLSGKWLMLLATLSILSGCSTHPVEHLSADSLDTGDTAFMLISAALVLLMTPALALFYGGLVRTRNVLSVVMHCLVSMGIITLLWILCGYSLAFAPSSFSIGDKGIIGSFQWAFLGSRNIGMDPHPIYSATVPHRLFMIFQGMFAIITPALIAGAVAERMKFKTYIVFICLWLLLVYCPVCHWVWSENGWLKKIGSLDFAGGTVVHMTSGFTALLVAIMIGPRRGFPREAFIPHNLVLTVLGAGLLWFGWFGFNGGSAIGSGKVAVVAFIATHIAAAAGAFAWMMVDWLTKDKPTALGAASGAVAGLVAITPASGFVGPLSAAVIGAIAGIVCSYAVTWRARKGIDDALDAFGVHGVGGTIGAVLTGVFASSYLNPALSSTAEDGTVTKTEGLIHGNVSLVVAQLTAVGITIVFTCVVSYVLLKVLDLTMGLRVTPEEEQMGLDLTQHGEAAYSS